MPLASGSHLGPYEIVTPLGAGGMGEVYRARDSRLKRDIALKVLLDGVASDPDRLARFQREAEALASLNHPNIGAIYGMEGNALVLELIEGPTLADRIAQGPIPLQEALPLIAQIVDALEYAHEKGIVHRDLKPANIKITPSGSVKLLDFGLAKALANEPPAGDPASLPTLTMRATLTGAIMGTISYMAPEQARGQTVDKRADIWAFGVVVYEMLAGRMLFDGPTVSDALAQILTKEPDFADVPVRVQELLKRSVERDVRKRLRDIGDARILLEESAARAAVPAAAKQRFPIALAAAAVLLAITTAGLAWVHFSEHAQPLQPIRFEIPISEPVSGIEVSPDGRKLAIVVDQTDARMIEVRALDSPQLLTLRGSEGLSTRPAWTLDSRALIFGLSGKLRRVDVATGAGETLADLPRGMNGSITTAPDGSIYVSTMSGLDRFPAAGGPPVPVLPPEVGIRTLEFAPDNKHFLYAAAPAGLTGAASGIFSSSAEELKDLPSKWAHAKPLFTTDVAYFVIVSTSDPRSGYVLFTSNGAVTAQPIELPGLTPAGPAFTLTDSVDLFGASAGVLAYRLGSNAIQVRMRWFDRHGKESGEVGEQGSFQNVQLSPDGKTLLTNRVDSGIGHVWTGDVSRGVFSRLTNSDASETATVIGADGTIIFTSAEGGGVGDLYILRPNSNHPELLVRSSYLSHPTDISRDGKYLIFDEHGPQHQDLYVVPMDGPLESRKRVPLVVTPADESLGEFSPDGKWVAYYSDESGRPEIYVRAFLPGQNPASGARKWLISTAGGNKPRWSRDGNELYYIANQKLMAVPVKTGERFEAGIPVALFDAPRASGYYPYDVAPDGRFLFAARVDHPHNTAPITVVVNWAAPLKSR